MIYFYLAAKYGYRQRMLPIAAALMLQGHGVTSQWINGTHDGKTPEESLRSANADLEHIDNCTHLVLFNLPIGNAEQSSGRNVEFGYALARRKSLIVVGEGNSIFYTKANMTFDTVETFLAEFAPGSQL